MNDIMPVIAITDNPLRPFPPNFSRTDSDPVKLLRIFLLTFSISTQHNNFFLRHAVAIVACHAVSSLFYASTPAIAIIAGVNTLSTVQRAFSSQLNS